MKKVIIGVCLLTGIATGVFMYINKTPKITVSPTYKEYTYTGSTPSDLIKIKNPRSFSEVVNYAQLIIKGEITTVQDVSNTVKMQEGTPEKKLSDSTGGVSAYVNDAVRYTIKVSDTIKGSAYGDEITLYRSKGDEELSPNLRVGDNYVFLLTWNENIKCYIEGHPAASYYKIEKDNKVTPINKDTSDFTKLQGKPYDNLKSVIKKIK